MSSHFGDSEYHDLSVEIRDDIAIVAINRPKVLNALSRKTKRELRDFFQKANERADFKAVILTGGGEQSFCAGTDLKDMGTHETVEGVDMLWLEHRMNEAIRYCNKPVIAAVNGYALGSGCLMTILCDYSVVADSAILGFPEIKAGLPSCIEIALLPRLVGLAKAREMTYFGEPISAKEALDIGLINKIVPKEAVMQAAVQIARKFIAISPAARRSQKELINKWIETDFKAAVEYSIPLGGVCFATGEPKIEIQKFLDKKRK
ncbi:MAG TPA: enoyl-CoA hydratase/isomerase family protein [Bacilli bacterium]